MNLAEFLLARIDEDEAAARAIPSTLRQWEWDESEWDVVGLSAPVASAGYDGVGPHIVRWQPDRVLAECEAKRRIVGSLVWHVQNADRPGISVGEYLLAEQHAKVLALPYADHPDYRQEWKL